jgi:hypothetical protein
MVDPTKKPQTFRIRRDMVISSTGIGEARYQSVYSTVEFQMGIGPRRRTRREGGMMNDLLARNSKFPELPASMRDWAPEVKG